MKRKILNFSGAAFLCAVFMVFAGPSGSQTNTNYQGDKMNKKVLVVYYSWSGNTAEMAKIIQEETGGDIFEIRTVKPYPAEYRATTEQAKKEINEGNKPAIKGKVDNINEYDVIFIGSPNWWGTVAPAVNTFLSEHDLSGKTVVPFFTHGGGGMQRCASDITKLLPRSDVGEAATFSGSMVKNSQEKVSEWVNKVLK